MSSLSWDGEGGDRLAVSYCSPEFLACTLAASSDGFVFRASQPGSHCGRLSSSSCLSALQINPRAGQLVGAGTQAGGVGWWDTRMAGLAARTVSAESHGGPVSSLVWVNSKTDSEMMTASGDGTVKLWDTRKFSYSRETFVIDLNNKDKKSLGDIDTAQGASFLSYDPTIPSKYLVGTEAGRLLCCSRKARSQPETITARFSGHHGSVRYLERNPAASKYFLSLADTSAKVWAEEVSDSPVWWTKTAAHHSLTHGCWAPARPSVFLTADLSGAVIARVGN